MAKGNPPKKDGYIRRHWHNQACFEQPELKCNKDHEHNNASCWKQSKKICPLENGQQI